ncbi:hypothetical protein ABZ783_23000 [Micromonospora sp. NPDC047738]|uniref:hypothetical protein n=1 Tax=Micromonospora sp. NPDC047738 TaxID=3155741 RepID=UPI0033F57C8F
MLPSLQYTDFHKFLVSVGGVACGVGVGIPVLLLRNQSTLKIPQKEFLELNSDAREAIRAQQSQVAFMLHYWPYASAVLVIAGLCFIIWGATLWKRQQSRTDNREIAELAKIEAEREKTYQETLVLLRNHQESPEVAELIREEKEQASDPAADNEMPSPLEIAGTDQPMPGPDSISTTKATAGQPVPSLGKMTQIATQDIMRALASTYGEELDVVPEIRIGSTYVDAAVTSRNPRIPNLLVDVRVIRPQRTSVRTRVDEAIAWSVRVRRAAKLELKQPFLPVVFFVVDANGGPGQQALFQIGQPDANAVVASRVRQALEDLAGIEIPLLLIVGALDEITPEALKRIHWKAHTPRVVGLTAVSATEQTAAT